MHIKNDNFVVEDPFFKEFDAAINFTSRRDSPSSYLQYATMSTGYYYVYISSTGGDWASSGDNTFTVNFTLPKNYSKCILSADFSIINGSSRGSYSHSMSVTFQGKSISASGYGHQQITIDGPFIKGSSLSFSAYVSAYGKDGTMMNWTSASYINNLKLVFYK